jgi:DNA primase
VAGLIREEDIALVRERSRIDEVVSAHVTLRNAGSGSMKGLCPFHDEKTPSFTVTPARGFFHCFGCQAGGDVFDFVQRIEGVGFSEAVERLAGRYAVELHYVDEGRSGPRRNPGERSRLTEANRLAAQFYQDALATPEALAGRQFLGARGFDQDAAGMFGVGFAPRAGDALLTHLRNKGFSDVELVTAGLVARSDRGPYDRFRGRLLWPIHELSGEVVGFGARRLFDDDHVTAKYLNTPETPVYKKSHLLYGVDLARKEIARTSQAVVVEGYTDVMACHLAGVQTAVATCGTSFGEDHTRVLRRLLLDHDEFHNEVIFTFDGDAAGQKAALRAFQGDQQFVGQTYVAVEPGGRDPCDLRLAEGDAAVRELVARREPLYRFVLRHVVSRFDLDRADSRIDAVREAAKLVASIRDRSKVEAFARELAGMVGAEVDDVRAEVRRVTATKASSGGGVNQPGVGASRADVPDPGERRFSIERDVLKLAIQNPAVMGPLWSEIEPEDFTHPY